MVAKDNSSSVAVQDQPPVVTRFALPERQTEEAQQAHERFKVEQRKHFEKMRPILTKCVDHEVAARYERQKPRYVYEISMNIMERDEKTKKLKSVAYSASEIEAQNEDEAWAMACDKI